MTFKDEVAKIFDVCSCKCKDLRNCYCNKYRKVPKIEHAFLLDQRDNRKMFNGGMDPKVTSRNLKKLRRQSVAAKMRMNKSGSSNVSQPQCHMYDNEEETQETGSDLHNDSTDPNIEPTRNFTFSRNTAELPNLAAACDCTGVSIMKCIDSSGMISDSFRRLGFVTSDSFFFLCVLCPPGMYFTNNVGRSKSKLVKTSMLAHSKSQRN